jgi:dienelactone hydrolase
METHRYLDVPKRPGSFPALIIIHELYGIFTRLNSGTSTEVRSCAQRRGSTRGNDSRPA